MTAQFADRFPYKIGAILSADRWLRVDGGLSVFDLSSNQSRRLCDVWNSGGWRLEGDSVWCGGFGELAAGQYGQWLRQFELDTGRVLWSYGIPLQ